MGAGLRLFAVVVGACWLLVALLLFVPIRVGDAGMSGERCPRPVPAALTDGDFYCFARSRERLGTAALWLVFTGAVSTAFVARCAVAGRRPE